MRHQVLHREREKIPGNCPVHVTFRVRKDVPSLRTRRLVREFRRSLAKACERGRFRVVHYSIQRNHVHLLVEAHVRKHRAQNGGGAPPVRLDEASSGRWFEGWKRPPPVTGTVGIRDVAPARSWLLATGWRRHGLIDPGEVPGTV